MTKFAIADCGKGTQHYALAGAHKTLCGKRVERVLENATFSDRWDCQTCRKAAEKKAN